MGVCRSCADKAFSEGDGVIVSVLRIREEGPAPDARPSSPSSSSALW